jgi:hypothetical protein
MLPQFEYQHYLNALKEVGRDSVLIISTRYGPDGLEIESRWGEGEIFRIRPERPWGPPSLLYSAVRTGSRSQR